MPPKPLTYYAILFLIASPLAAMTQATLLVACCLVLGSGCFGIVCHLAGQDAVYRAANREHAERASRCSPIPNRPTSREIDEWIAALPGLLRGHGYLYVVAFDTGVIKVGQTCEPRRRIYDHRRNGEAFGARITNLWVSDPHRNYATNEALLLARCAAIGTRLKSEYFRGVPFRTAVWLASRLECRTVRAEVTA